jgi:hypothetical protein
MLRWRGCCVDALLSVARNFCFSRACLGADLYGGIVNAHSGTSIQSYQWVRRQYVVGVGKSANLAKVTYW